MNARLDREQRVAILTPSGRDGELTCKVLAQAGVDCMICGNLHALCSEVRDGLGAVLVAEEAIFAEEDMTLLASALAQQPQWSDLPVLVLTARGADSPTVARSLETLGNVTLLERPLRVGALVSSTRAAVRARQRQYQIRAHIAERETTEESLREADRRKDEFLATLAHELRNPLAAISNGAQLLRMIPEQNSLRGASDVIDRQVRHLARLVEDLLDVSRISRHKIELRRSRTDLAGIINTAIETSQPSITEREHQFSVTLPAEPLLIYADPTRLAQVISNLLSNAAKFTPRGGRMALTATRDNDFVTIRVTDSGIGIDAAMLSKIFEMFIQADNRIERTTAGLGIGLTLVRHFVRMHGGTVEASSAGRNRGSEFVIRLPLGPPAHAAGGAHASDDRRTPPGGGLRILVVDDNRDSAESMSSLLQFLGNEVTTASEGSQALDYIAQALPDVALLDIGMPNMNGYEVAVDIRSHPHGADIMLIAMTGWGQECDRVRSRASGFDYHLVKPVDIGQLQQILDEKLSRLAATARPAKSRSLH